MSLNSRLRPVVAASLPFVAVVAVDVIAMSSRFERQVDHRFERHRFEA